jgi:hypothetical protein
VRVVCLLQESARMSETTSVLLRIVKVYESGIALNEGREGMLSPRRGKSPKLKERRHGLVLRIDCP